MKAIILSAGQGPRQGHFVNDWPKCLIDFNGCDPLNRPLDTLESSGVLDNRGEEWSEVDFPFDADAARELASRWDAIRVVAA
jgi:choline kinase